jgi:hypothetical protein
MNMIAKMAHNASVRLRMAQLKFLENVMISPQFIELSQHQGSKGQSAESVEADLFPFLPLSL